MIDLAYAMGPPPQSSGGAASVMIQLVPIILVLGIFFFLVIRPQQRERRRREEMLRALKKGDRVVAAVGLICTIFAFTRSMTALAFSPVRITTVPPTASVPFKSSAPRRKSPPI